MKTYLNNLWEGKILISKLIGKDCQLRMYVFIDIFKVVPDLLQETLNSKSGLKMKTFLEFAKSHKLFSQPMKFKVNPKKSGVSCRAKRGKGSLTDGHASSLAGFRLTFD